MEPTFRPWSCKATSCTWSRSWYPRPARIAFAIKAADPSFSDLVHEITVAQGEQTYTVKAGDNLSKISKLFYGDANQYQKIADANGLDNPDKIRVGQTLTIPAA